MNWRILFEEKLVPSLFAGLAIALVVYFFKLAAASAILFASLGASAFILVGYSDTAPAKLRKVLLAYFCAGLVGSACAFIPNLVLAAGLAVGLATALMLLARAPHLPAAGAALAFVFFSRSPAEFVTLVLAILVLLFLIKLIFISIKKSCTSKNFIMSF